MNKVLELSIKYTIKDIFVAVNYKFGLVINLIRSNNQTKLIAYILIIIKPFLLLGIWISKYKVLRNIIHFELSEMHMKVIRNKEQNIIEWSRFCEYVETKNFIMIQLDKELGQGDGQSLFPKRIFKEEEIDFLKSILEKNSIKKGAIDLNMDL